MKHDETIEREAREWIAGLITMNNRPVDRPDVLEFAFCAGAQAERKRAEKLIKAQSELIALYRELAECGCIEYSDRARDKECDLEDDVARALKEWESK
jgi:hypothetical protein